VTLPHHGRGLIVVIDARTLALTDISVHDLDTPACSRSLGR